MNAAMFGRRMRGRERRGERQRERDGLERRKNTEYMSP